MLIQFLYLEQLNILLESGPDTTIVPSYGRVHVACDRNVACDRMMMGWFVDGHSCSIYLLLSKICSTYGKICRDNNLLLPLVVPQSKFTKNMMTTTTYIILNTYIKSNTRVRESMRYINSIFNYQHPSWMLWYICFVLDTNSENKIKNGFYYFA